jgi:hypothetical protein
MQVYCRLSLQITYLATRAQCGVINTAALWHNLNKQLYLFTTLMQPFMPARHKSRVAFFVNRPAMCIYPK